MTNKHSRQGLYAVIFVLFIIAGISGALLYQDSLTRLISLAKGTSTDIATTDSEMVAATYTALTTYKSTSTITAVPMTVVITRPVRTVPKTVYGQGLLSFYSSDAFVHTSTFLQTVKDSGVGALRWPSAGHSNVPIFHFDNNHTNYFDGKSGYLDPAKTGYTTKQPGNIWDPLYTASDAGKPTEQVTLRGFVDTLKTTSTTPMMIFTWRSGELWRIVNGQRVSYRDPAPRNLDGTAMSAADAAKLNAEDQQKLENKLMLKEYFANGGPTGLIAQIGEELWSGWEDGQIPWEETTISNPRKLSKGEWIAQTLKIYFTDLAIFAKANNYPVRFAVQFRESAEGGDQMPIPQKQIAFLQTDLNSLLTNLGPNVSYMTASVHYRSDWNTWLTEPQMQMAFMTDKGQGSLADIRTWFKKYVAAKGYPNIEFIPHANSFGEIPDKSIPVAPWQLGLMSSQYLIEAIKAGYDYTFGFPGFLGDYDAFASLDKAPGVAGMQSGVYTKAPMLYALSSIGEALQHNAQLVNISNPDPTIVSLGLLSTHHLRIYLINKHTSTTTTSIDTGADLTKSVINVQRYSEHETTLPKIIPQTVLNAYPTNPNKVFATLAPYSMTVIDISR